MIMKKKHVLSRKRPPVLILGGLSLLLCLSLACSSGDGTPTSGTSSQKTEARLLIGSETEAAVGVIDLEQSALESSTKSYSSAPEMIASPEGQFAFMVQSSGNRVDVLKMGTSVAITDSSTEAASEADDDGHDHGHDHGKPRASSDSEESSSATSSVVSVSLSLTGENLGRVVSKGEWISFQFDNKVYVLSEEGLESQLDSLTESPLYEKASQLPGVPLDAEHIALGANVFEIMEDTQVHGSANVVALSLTSDNILSATRSTEGIALFGTDQGVLLVCKHTESGNTEWEDFMVPYPTIVEENIYLASDHDHEGEEEDESVDEHDEVAENVIATQWASHDALGHAFAHLTHETHSAGIYLIEASTLEEDSVQEAWTYIDGTSDASARPVAMTIAKMPEAEHEEDEEHVDEYRLLILMSSGNLRIHDAVEEGAFIAELSGVVASVEDFHEGEGNFPGLTAGLGKVYVGDPSRHLIHQIDLSTLSIELTWSSDLSPNRLLLLGESSRAEGESDHDHDHE